MSEQVIVTSMNGKLSIFAPGIRRPCQKASNNAPLDRCHRGMSSSSVLPASAPHQDLNFQEMHRAILSDNPRNIVQLKFTHFMSPSIPKIDATGKLGPEKAVAMLLEVQGHDDAIDNQITRISYLVLLAGFAVLVEYLELGCAFAVGAESCCSW